MKKQPNNIGIDPKTKSVMDAFASPDAKKSDPQGSYTGVPKNEQEVPVQDADDL